MAKHEINTGLYLVAMIGIVAVIGLVVLVMNSGGSSLELGTDDLTGEAYTGATRVEGKYDALTTTSSTTLDESDTITLASQSTYDCFTCVDTIVNGFRSNAFGSETVANGDYSTAMGMKTKAYGDYSIAMGFNSRASGEYSTSIGAGTEASGTTSVAMGGYTKASGDHSTALGSSSEASGTTSVAMGQATKASGDHSTTTGYDTEASGRGSTAMGSWARAIHDFSFVVGLGTGADDFCESTNEKEFRICGDLAVEGLPTSEPDASGTAGIVCVTNDGSFWIDNDGTYDCQ